VQGSKVREAFNSSPQPLGPQAPDSQKTPKIGGESRQGGLKGLAFRIFEGSTSAGQRILDRVKQGKEAWVLQISEPDIPRTLSTSDVLQEVCVETAVQRSVDELRGKVAALVVDAKAQQSLALEVTDVEGGQAPNP